MKTVRVLSGLVFGAMAGVLVGVVLPFLLAFLVMVVDDELAAAVPWAIFITVPMGLFVGAGLGATYEAKKDGPSSSNEPIDDSRSKYEG